MGRRQYGSSLSARYEDEYEDARAAHSGGPSSVICDFGDADDAPARPASRRIGFVMPDSTHEEIDPLLHEGDQA